MVKKSFNSSVSFIIPTLNEELNMARCLSSVAKQTYPNELIDVIVADGGSTDTTCDICESWANASGIRLRVLNNPKRVAEFGKALAIDASDADFIVMLDADNEIVQTDWLARALHAFDVFPDIYGFESYCLRIPQGKPITNYLACCRIFCDPLASDVAIMPKRLLTTESDGMRYEKYRLPPGFPSGANGYIFKRSRISEQIGRETFEEGQVSLKMALSDQPFFARITGYGIYHHYTDSFSAFVRKRAKIALKYTTRSQERDTWVNYTGKRLYIYAFLHITFAYPLGLSIVKMILHREPLWLMHAPVCFVTAVSYAVNWLYIKLSGKRAW